MAIFKIQPKRAEDGRIGAWKTVDSVARTPKVALVSDTADLSLIPAEVSAVIGATSVTPLAAGVELRAVGAGDGALLWMAGETLLQGDAERLRQQLKHPHVRWFVPIHFPCLPELDLVGLAPRVIGAAAREDKIDLELHIQAGAGSAEFTAFLAASTEPWARLLLVLHQGVSRPTDAIVELRGLLPVVAHQPVLQALILRNLAVLLMRLERWEPAEEVLREATRLFPSDAEFRFLLGWLRIERGRPSEAVPELLRAGQFPEYPSIGSGGQQSYRAGLLLGKVAESIGNYEMAVSLYAHGLSSVPAYEPSVRAFLNAPHGLEEMNTHQYVLCQLVRKEPRYLDLVLEKLISQRRFTIARRLVTSMDLADAVRQDWLQRIGTTEAPYLPRERKPGERAGVVLTSLFFTHQSYSRPARELANAILQAPDMDGRIESWRLWTDRAELFPYSDVLKEGMSRHPARLDLTIRHYWPYQFERPPAGKLVWMAPCEYGAVSVEWIEGMEKNVDEVWVPSEFVRSVYVRGGVSPEKVVTIPLGFNPAVFTPEGPSWRPPGCKSFVFLFLSSLVTRKAPDVLVEAYNLAFSPDDDVTLLIHDSGWKNYTRGCSMIGQLAEFAENPNNPHLLIHGNSIDDQQIAGLYRGCDAFVLPYRAEGFGFPILESLACGKPVIAPSLGPAVEICPPDCGYFVPAEVATVPPEEQWLERLSGEFTWFEYDVEDLAAIMRHVYEHRDEAAARGRKGAESVLKTHNWARIAGLHLDRMRHVINH